MTEFVEGLLSRCVNETDAEVRDLLASCIGEVGAISIHYLEERDSSSQKCDARKRAPWHSRADRYGLQLVTNELVAALKAAPSANDQHKIAFSIQQILVLLDRAATEGEATSTKSLSKSEEKHAMTEWLRSNLFDAGVLEVVEPFWTTEFCEVSLLTASFLYRVCEYEYSTACFSTEFFRCFSSQPFAHPPFRVRLVLRKGLLSFATLQPTLDGCRIGAATWSSNRRKRRINGVTYSILVEHPYELMWVLMLLSFCFRLSC